MTQEIYIQSENPSGEYSCTIESDEQTVWMYLHDIKNAGVIGDCPICSLIPLIDLSEFKSSYIGNGAPPLVKEYSNSIAYIPDITNEQLQILWLNDGISPLVSLVGEPFCMIRVNEKLGYTKAIKVKGPWGHPWDNNLYQRLER